MPFLTDLTTDDVVTLKSEGTESVVRLRVAKKSGGKVRLSIDAGKEIRIIKKQQPKKAPKTLNSEQL